MIHGVSGSPIFLLPCLPSSGSVLMLGVRKLLRFVNLLNRRIEVMKSSFSGSLGLQRRSRGGLSGPQCSPRFGGLHFAVTWCFGVTGGDARRGRTGSAA
jgi:hypothetical protein